MMGQYVASNLLSHILSGCHRKIRRFTHYPVEGVARRIRVDSLSRSIQHMNQISRGITISARSYGHTSSISSEHGMKLDERDGNIFPGTSMGHAVRI